MLRKRVMFEQPLCAVEGCNELSRDLDHVVPLAQGGAEYARENVQGLCPFHHHQKTAREAAGRGLDDAA